MNEDRVTKPQRSLGSKMIELVIWAAISLLTAWLMIENIETILPANNF